MSTAKPHLAWVPNALTIGRIVFIPVLIGGILTYGSPKAFLGAVPLFILFAILIFTDFLDGFFARRWQVTSNFGRMIDPIADKLFVAGLLITFAILTQGAWWLPNGKRQQRWPPLQPCLSGYLRAKRYRYHARSALCCYGLPQAYQPIQAYITYGKAGLN